jgi:hypothetical protein
MFIGSVIGPAMFIGPALFVGQSTTDGRHYSKKLHTLLESGSPLGGVSCLG